VINPIVKYMKDYYKEDNPEIFLPKKYASSAKKLKDVDVNTISRYVGNITLDVK
jgi:hypothetical protein